MEAVEVIMLRIYVHRLCHTSIRLLRILHEKKIGDIKIVDIGQNPLALVSMGIVSVPAVEVDGSIIDFGPIDPDNILSIIAEEKKISLSPIEDAIEAIYKEILDNLFIALTIYLRGSIALVFEYRPIVDKIRSRMNERIV